MTKHYHGDDNDLKVLMGGIVRAFAGVTVEAYGDAARARSCARHTPRSSAGSATAVTFR